MRCSFVVNTSGRSLSIIRRKRDNSQLDPDPSCRRHCMWLRSSDIRISSSELHPADADENLLQVFTICHLPFAIWRLGDGSTKIAYIITTSIFPRQDGEDDTKKNKRKMKCHIMMKIKAYCLLLGSEPRHEDFRREGHSQPTTSALSQARLSLCMIRSHLGIVLSMKWCASAGNSCRMGRVSLARPPMGQ